MAGDRAVTPRRDRRALGGLARVLGVLMPVAAIAGLVAGYARYRRSQVIDDVLAGAPLDHELAAAADAFVEWSRVVGLTLGLAAVAVFLIWSLRHASNSTVLDRRRAPRAGWAIGSWLVPVANFWLPAVNLLRADRVSDRHGRPLRLVIGWAAALGVAVVVTVLLHRAAPAELSTVRDVQLYALADRLELVAQLAFAVSALLGARMVGSLTDRQDRAFVLARRDCPA